MDTRDLARKERSFLIDQMISKASETDNLDLLSLLAMDFFMAPEDFSKVDLKVAQACNEFVVGLLSSKAVSKEGKIPEPKDLNEIKQLWQKIIATYIVESLPGSKAVESFNSREVEKVGSTFFILSYFLTVRGEGYPNQLWDAAVEVYSPHNPYLKKKLGFTIEQAVNIFRWLFREIEKKGNAHALDFASIMKGPMDIWKKWAEGEIDHAEMLSKVREIDKASLSQQIKLHNKRTKNIFTFSIIEIERKFGKDVVNSFLKRFAASFGEINKNYSDPTQFNEIYRTPIPIIDEDSIFIPVPPLLCQVPVVTLHYDLIQDLEYEAQYTEARGKHLETKASMLLGSIFGALSFHSNLHFTNHKGEDGEIDLLVQFDNKVIVVECKSKSLTLPAKQGDLNQIGNDFSNAIQLAYDQNQRAIDYIRSVGKADFYQSDGKKISVRRNRISDVFSIIVTANTYATLGTDLSVFLKKDPDDYYPWAVCIRDLELIAEYLFDPYLFMHFLKRRLALHGRVLSPDEMDYVGCYLMEGLYFEEELKKADWIMLLGFTEQFDADQLRKIGKLKTAQVGTSWSNPAYENLIGSIKLIGDHGHSDIILALLDVDSKTRDNLIKFIQSTVGRTLKNGKAHDFSMIGKDFGFSFIADVTRTNLRKRVYTNGLLKKYKHKATKWLAMGRDVMDSKYLVNEFTYLNYEWKFDPTMEKRVKRYLKKGKRFKL